MSTPVPHLTLNSGHQIPQLGLGVFQVDADSAKRVVLDALEIGYRHIDGAWYYQNEDGVGEAIAQSGIAREELFITTKLWSPFQGRTTAWDGLNDSLEKLGLDYVDLYLIHWPSPKREAYVDSWLAFEEFVAEGLVRSIGVSNFLPEHVDKVLEAGSIVPAVNQIELHPAFQQKAQRAFQEPLGILTEAWGPLGQGKYDLAEIPALSSAAEQTGKSLAQVAIRWMIQEGIILFPKTSRRERLQENFDVFDFELSDQQMEAIRAADLDRRGGTHPLEGNW
jgi:2,5-diketo-D-gluconate reductase A